MGIIPTRVGTSHFIPIFRCVREDHPHACGDKFDYVYTTVYTIGSSPRVWGQEDEEAYFNQVSRIIPTRVGTSNSQKQLCNGTQGSSPRVWGQEVNP